MNIRPGTLLEENVGGKLLDIGLGHDLGDLTPKAKVGLPLTEKLLYSKGNHQQNGGGEGTY